MKVKRTVTIEIERVKVTTTHCAKNIFRCEQCQAETEFFSRAEAAELAKIMRMQGFEINQANLHFYEPDDEQILICLNSILEGRSLRINKIIT